jgi:hypothetical protein
MGYTGGNIMMSAFGPIYDNPFGTVGDSALIPDLSTKVDVEFAGFCARALLRPTARHSRNGSRWNSEKSEPDEASSALPSAAEEWRDEIAAVGT